MSAPEMPWAVTISVRTPTAELAGWLEQALLPEVSREVPRARTAVSRPTPNSVEVAIRARDTGAVRAALNTHLDWVHLALAVVPRASGGPA
ncbi:MAG TPA: KEOPS complex subunit Pcc1 [Thermoplasmata archaeon]|nr:KEOPS complex subunit Pcc1 [Thermoplasmata archaeon]